MRADSGTSPVDGLMHVGERRPSLDDAGDEFVNQVRMRSAVSAALDEREVRVFIVVYALGGEALNLLGQESRVVRHIHSFRLLAHVQYGLLAFDPCPLERHFIRIHVELSMYWRAVSNRERVTSKASGWPRT